MARRQGIFWLLTIPHADFVPYPVPATSWVKGQLEEGAGGYLHWQVFVAFSEKKSLAGVKEVFGRSTHAELSRSESASDYVWKEDTRVPGTQFEFGHKPFRRNSKPDWDAIWDAAVGSDLMAVPSHLRVSHYSALKRIGSDFAKPVGMERTCVVYWGLTGVGKSRRAWEEATLDAYPKDPRTKFWCGYCGQRSVVIDEFRGGIDVGHLLRWLDRYPVIVEIKGGSVCLKASNIFITSNLAPEQWYPELDLATKDALMRRLEIINLL